jgi:hypothetical protein
LLKTKVIKWPFNFIKCKIEDAFCLQEYFGSIPGKEIPRVLKVTPGKSSLWEFLK